MTKFSQGKLSKILIIEGYEMDLQAIEHVRNLITDMGTGLTVDRRAVALMVLKILEQNANDAFDRYHHQRQRITRK